MSHQGRNQALNEESKQHIKETVKQNPDESIRKLHQQDNQGVSYTTYNKAVHETNARDENDIQADQVGGSSSSSGYQGQGRNTSLSDQDKDDIKNTVQDNPDASIRELHQQDGKGVSYTTYNKAVHETNARSDEEIKAAQVGQSTGE